MSNGWKNGAIDSNRAPRGMQITKSKFWMFFSNFLHMPEGEAGGVDLMWNAWKRFLQLPAFRSMDVTVLCVYCAHHSVYEQSVGNLGMWITEGFGMWPSALKPQWLLPKSENLDLYPDQTFIF